MHNIEADRRKGKTQYAAEKKRDPHIGSKKNEGDVNPYKGCKKNKAFNK
jgi:hypothetical protein